MKNGNFLSKYLEMFFPYDFFLQFKDIFQDIYSKKTLQTCLQHFKSFDLGLFRLYKTLYIT